MRPIFVGTEEKVIWFDIAVNEVVLVNVLDGIELRR